MNMKALELILGFLQAPHLMAFVPLFKPQRLRVHLRGLSASHLAQYSHYLLNRFMLPPNAEP